MAVKMHLRHKEIITRLRLASGKAEKNAFLDNYLGSPHPKYPISTPDLRKIARTWMNENRGLPASEFAALITSLTAGKSFTEKVLAGIMLGYAKPEQRRFDIRIFDTWLEQLEGWAEVDALCTGKFTQNEVPENPDAWSELLRKLNKSKNIHKRRASLVILCSPLSHSKDEDLRNTAFTLINGVKHEKHILITKAISWLLRSMVRHHQDAVNDYLDENDETLPRIAVRETRVKLLTGRKTAGKRRPD